MISAVPAGLPPCLPQLPAINRRAIIVASLRDAFSQTLTTARGLLILARLSISTPKSHLDGNLPAPRGESHATPNSISASHPWPISFLRRAGGSYLPVPMAVSASRRKLISARAKGHFSVARPFLRRAGGANDNSPAIYRRVEVKTNHRVP